MGQTKAIEQAVCDAPLEVVLVSLRRHPRDRRSKHMGTVMTRLQSSMMSSQTSCTMSWWVLPPNARPAECLTASLLGRDGNCCSSCGCAKKATVITLTMPPQRCTGTTFVTSSTPARRSNHVAQRARVAAMQADTACVQTGAMLQEHVEATKAARTPVTTRGTVLVAFQVCCEWLHRRADTTPPTAPANIVHKAACM
jgi:hypothetical protein